MAVDKGKARAFILPFERSVDHLYQDSEGIPTVAIGNAVTEASVQQLAFVHRDTGASASWEEIAQDFDAVMAQPKGHSASWYQQFTKLALPAPEQMALFDRRIDEFEGQLRGLFPGYEIFPDVCQLGLVDMIFNLGATTLRRGFPSFCAAVRSAPPDWRGAANNCHRARPAGQTPPAPGQPDLHEARQRAVKALFLTAAALPVSLR